MRSFSIGIILCLAVITSACGGTIVQTANGVDSEIYGLPAIPDTAAPEVVETPTEDPLLTDAELLEQGDGTIISFEKMASGEWRIVPPVFTIRNQSNVDLVVTGSVQSSIILITVRDIEDISARDVAIYDYKAISSPHTEPVGDIQERDGKYYFRYRGLPSDNPNRGLFHTSTQPDGKVIRVICSWNTFDSDAENDAFAQSIIDMANSVKFHGME